MRHARFRRAPILAVSAALTVFALGAGPVLAAPANDSVGGAIALAIPETYTEDTTTANQTDADEVALNANCGAPLVEHGVWFSITPSADMTVAFDTQDSNYSAGVMVFDGAPTANGLLNCGPQVVIMDVVATHTYNLLVFGDGFLTTETSGTLVFKVRPATPPPTLDLTVNKSGSVDRHGNVHVWGDATCTSSDGSGLVFEIFGDVTQRVGRILIRGFFDTSPLTPCDGQPHRWDAYFTGDNGIFAGGKAITVAIGFGCTDLCSDSIIDATVQLNRAGK
jgi:hypothetical protein